jgi:hypothetical protein
MIVSFADPDSIWAVFLDAEIRIAEEGVLRL